MLLDGHYPERFPRQSADNVVEEFSILVGAMAVRGSGRGIRGRINTGSRRMDGYLRRNL